MVLYLRKLCDSACVCILLTLQYFWGTQGAGSCVCWNVLPEVYIHDLFHCFSEDRSMNFTRGFYKRYKIYFTFWHRNLIWWSYGRRYENNTLVTWTNKMHYFLLICFNNKHLHVSSRLAAHHQEDQLCINSNWYSHALRWLYQLLFIHSWSS
jgi:hypothetical protein